MHLLRSRIALICALALLISCGNEVTHSSLDAFVSSEASKQAFEIIETIDYLPFAFKDGCYARAFFMAMELAARGIPSSSQFIAGDLHPTAKLSWRYHVAPMLIVGNRREATIIDPSLLPSPAPLDSWVRSNNPVGKISLSAVPGSFYRPNSPAAPSEQRIVASFSEMPAFDVSNVREACSTLYSYLGNENAPNVTQKRAKLAERAQLLIQELSRRGKLRLDGPMGSMSHENMAEACSEFGPLTL